MGGACLFGGSLFWGCCPPVCPPVCSISRSRSSCDSVWLSRSRSVSALSARAWMGPPPGSVWAIRAIFVSCASTLPTGSLAPPPPACDVVEGLCCWGGLSDCVDATVTTCCCIAVTAVGWGSWSGGLAVAVGGCCCGAVCWWKMPARLRCISTVLSDWFVVAVVVVLVVVVVVVVVVVGRAGGGCGRGGRLPSSSSDDPSIAHPCKGVWFGVRGLLLVGG